MRNRLYRALRRFPAARRGVAAVEFALILPLMLTLYLGTMEVSDLIAVDRKVTVISGTIADLVARADTTVTTARLSDFFRASEGMIMPYRPQPLRQTVTFLTVAANGTATVAWSCGFNGGSARGVSSTVTLPSATRAVAQEVGFVVMSDVEYAYRPLLGVVIGSAINLRQVNYFAPRYRKAISRTGACPTS